jgi:dTDP-glucose 4,6-dehydratase
MRPVTETLIVTGGAGFIGSNFVRHVLSQTPWRVAVVDKLTYAGNLANLSDVQTRERGGDRYSFVHADIADGPAMQRVFEEYGPTFVVNFAAESHVDRSIDGPRAFVETNLCGTFELLEAARALLRRVPALRSAFRFLHVSTDEVYGTLDATGRFSETTPYAPNSPYAATKAGADHLVRAYFETYELPALITNCSNNYGPYQYPEKLIPLMVLNALDGKPLPIYGDGRNVRDWIYVEDHCAGVLRALERGRPGQKYNLGGNTERDNLTIVNTLCSILERLAPAKNNLALRQRGISEYAQLKTFVADRPGHDRRYAIDASKARDELEWEPRETLDSGLLRTVAWYLEHRAWCETVESGKAGRSRLGLRDGKPHVESSK